MPEKYTCGIGDIISKFSLETLYMPDREIKIESMDINRPGLALTGFTGHFDNKRIQILGKSEHQYLQELTDSEREKHLETFMALQPPALIYSSSLDPSSGVIDIKSARTASNWLFVIPFSFSFSP